MRTARATVPLDSNERPASITALAKATEALHQLTTLTPTTAVRFAGWLPTGHRHACYEADYPDA